MQKVPASPLAILVALSWSVHSSLTHALLYCCALYNFIFLDFVSVDLALTGFKVLKHPTSTVLEHFRVGCRAQTRPHVRAAGLAHWSDYCFCWASEQKWQKSLGHWFSKHWKSSDPRWGFFNRHPSDWLFLQHIKLLPYKAQVSPWSTTFHLILAIFFGFFLKRLEIKGTEQWLPRFPLRLPWPVFITCLFSEASSSNCQVRIRPRQFLWAVPFQTSLCLQTPQSQHQSELSYEPPPLPPARFL